MICEHIIAASSADRPGYAYRGHQRMTCWRVSLRDVEPRTGGAIPKFGLPSTVTVNRTVTQLLRRILTRARKGATFARTRKSVGAEDFHIHDLRHTSETHTLRASKNLRAVKEMLGHADIKITMRYAHALIDDVAEAMTARVSAESTRRAVHDSRTKSRETPEQPSDGAPKLLNQRKK